MESEELKHLHITMPSKIYADMMIDMQENQKFYKKGDIKKFIIKAIKNQIAIDRTHTQATRFDNTFILFKGRMRLNRLMQGIIEYRVQKGRPRLEKGFRLSLAELKEAIVNITGYHDPNQRALRKCIKDLVNNGYLSNNNANANVFMILNSGSDQDEQEARWNEIENKRLKENNMNAMKESEFNDILSTHM